MVVGQEYNVPYGIDLLQFAQARMIIPYIDRLNDGRTPFSYIPYYFSDNVAITALLPIGVGVKSIQSSIIPAGGTQLAVAQEPGDPTLSFDATGIPSGFVSVKTTIIDSEEADDSRDSGFYATLSNLPAFGPLSPLCWKVAHLSLFSDTNCGSSKILSIWLTSMLNFHKATSPM